MDLIETIFLGIMVLSIIAMFIGIPIWEYRSSVRIAKEIAEMEKQLEESRKRREDRADKIAEIIYNNLTDEEKEQLAKIIEEIESL